MVADLFSWIIVEEIGKLAESVCPRSKPLLLLASDLHSLFHIYNPKVHVVLEFLNGLQGSVAALINQVTEVCNTNGADAEGAKH